MHESGIISRIITVVLQAAAAQNAEAVLEVELLIGKLTFLDPAWLQQTYQMLTRGTILEGSTLRVLEGEAVVYCSNCAAERVLELSSRGCEEPLPSFNCPDCGGATEILRGTECLIKGIKI
jgi:hydrogenase nickel incorporation protein HypA/HybF